MLMLRLLPVCLRATFVEMLYCVLIESTETGNGVTDMALDIVGNGRTFSDDVSEASNSQP